MVTLYILRFLFSNIPQPQDVACDFLGSQKKSSSKTNRFQSFLDCIVHGFRAQSFRFFGWFRFALARSSSWGRSSLMWPHCVDHIHYIKVLVPPYMVSIENSFTYTAAHSKSACSSKAFCFVRAMPRSFHMDTRAFYVIWGSPILTIDPPKNHQNPITLNHAESRSVLFESRFRMAESRPITLNHACIFLSYMADIYI